MTCAKMKRKREPAVVEFAPRQIVAIREQRSMTRKQAAAAVGISARTWRYYEAGAQIPSRSVCILIRQLRDKKIP